jgi:putative ubiquitin-RnfH superfamily antitoxin RatB of RatAB toxin-antitoxin module
MAKRSITVEVVYAGAEQQILRRVELTEGSTVMQAIDASQIAKVLPHGAVDPDRLGIFSRKVPAEQVLQTGDRIEIYRPLTLDPMEARRRRAREN